MLRSPANRPTSKRFLALAGVFLLVLGGVWFLYGDQWRIATEINAARRELNANRPDAALGRLESLYSKFPQQSQILFWLAVAQRRLEHLSVAAELLDQAERLGHDANDIALQRALLRCRSGQFDEVEQLLKTSLAQGVSDETAVDVYDAMATGFVAAFRLRDAWQCLEYWKEWQPTAVKPRLLRAAISEQAGNREEAVVDYRVALQADPTNVQTRRKLGQVLLQLNRVEEAQAEFLEAQRHDPRSAQLRVDLAGCQRRLGLLEEAAETLQTLLKERIPDDVRAEALRNAGEVQLEFGKVDEALRLLQSSARLAPKETRVHYDLFRAYTLAGDAKQAQVHQQLHQQMADDTQRLKRIALTLIDEPGRADLRYEAGEILATNEFYEEAVGWLSSAVRVNPNHLPSHLALVDFYSRVGNLRLAAYHQQEVARLKAVSPHDAPAKVDGADEAAKSDSTKQSERTPRQESEQQKPPQKTAPAKEAADGAPN